MNERPRQILVQLVKQHGKALAEDGRLCKSLLNDALRNEFPKEMNVLVHAVEAKIVCELLTLNATIPQRVLIERLVQKLRDEKGTGEKEAKWAVESWALAFGLPPDPPPPDPPPPDPPPPDPPPPNGFNKTGLTVIIGVLILVGLVSLLSLALAIKGCGGPSLAPTTTLLPTGASPTIRTQPPSDASPTIRTQPPSDASPTIRTQPPSGLPVISPLDVAKFENEECIVEFIIKSKYDKFDWGLLLNSENDFRNANNFSVVIDKKTAGEKYKQIGIANLGNYFKVGTFIQVMGKIEKHQDKRSNREQFQIRVRDPEQIKLH